MTIIIGTNDSEILNGTAGADTINGRAGNDTLNGLGRPDTLRGGIGNDLLRGGHGDDLLAGGAGIDTASYSDAPGGVTANLMTRTSSGNRGADTLYSIENIAGSAFIDLLTGNESANVLLAAAGDDTLDGRGGNDTLVGGQGNDVVNGGEGTDSLFGSLGVDFLFGDGGADRLSGGLSDDLLVGGTGVDIAVFQGNRSDYVIQTTGSVTTVRDTRPNIAENGGTDAIAEIERLQFDDVTIDALMPSDALDDSATVAEDQVLEGASVLANDNDPDGDPLTVNEVNGVAANVGQEITLASGARLTMRLDGTYSYTPGTNQSGTDSFFYTASDGSGGPDTAQVTVDVSAIADEPAIDVQVLPGQAINEIRLITTSDVADTDGSEFIERIELAGVPAGVTLIGAPEGVIDVPGTPTTVTQEVALVLPTDQNTDFDLDIAAIAQELSNGDTATSTSSTDIILAAESSTTTTTFRACDQSIWGTGEQFTFTDDRFLGIDSVFRPKPLSFLNVKGTLEAELKAGLQSMLQFEGGNIDAELPYDLTVSTSYNKTTDSLLISPFASLARGGGFATNGPDGSYKLDFVFNYGVSARASFDVPNGIDDIPFVPNEITLFKANPRGNHRRNLLDIESDDIAGEIPLGPLGLFGKFAWPNVDTTSDPSTGSVFHSAGQSNNFLELGIDVDQALADIFLGGKNPLDLKFKRDILVTDVRGRVELADFDLSGGINFLQEFSMQENGLSGQIMFEIVAR